MSGSRTDWFPERLTTQAGVSGVASSSAITASIPILLLCKGKGTPTAAGWDAPTGLGTTRLLPRLIYGQSATGFI